MKSHNHFSRAIFTRFSVYDFTGGNSTAAFVIIITQTNFLNKYLSNVRTSAINVQFSLSQSLRRRYRGKRNSKAVPGRPLNAIQTILLCLRYRIRLTRVAMERVMDTIQFNVFNSSSFLCKSFVFPIFVQDYC